jgi:hypothetical protein
VRRQCLRLALYLNRTHKKEKKKKKKKKKKKEKKKKKKYNKTGKKWCLNKSLIKTHWNWNKKGEGFGT